MGGGTARIWFERTVRETTAAIPGARLQVMGEATTTASRPKSRQPVLTESSWGLSSRMRWFFIRPRLSEAGSSRSRVSRSRAGSSCLRDGKIAAVEGPGFPGSFRFSRRSAAGKWVLPGFIDAHAHAGVHEEAEGWAGQDTNERTDPVAAHVRALDAINPADLGFRDAIARRGAGRQREPGLGRPDRRPDRRGSHARAGRGPDGAARAGRDEVRAGREPRAGLRGAQRDPGDQARHRRGDPRRVRGRAGLPGQAGCCCGR